MYVGESDRCVEPSSRGMTLARLQQSMNSQLEKVGGDHKEVYTALNRYGKALDKVSQLADEVEGEVGIRRVC